MAEAVAGDRHSGEESEVVGGVDEGAGGEGAGPEPDDAEHDADDANEEDRRPGSGDLFGMEQREGDAGQDDRNGQDERRRLPGRQGRREVVKRLFAARAPAKEVDER